MRIAAIDIGTNSIHRVIAQTPGSGGFAVVDREREVVQIGRDSFTSSRLKRAAIRRSVDALRRLVQLARRHQVDHIVCTATAAVREAKNGGEFLSAARRASGVTPSVIPAAEEGRLIYLAVKSALQIGDQPSLIVDIGGGSMQLVVGNDERCLQALSAPLGALRLTETTLRSDPPSRRDLARLRKLVRKVAREPLETVRGYRPVGVFGSSGSIHALAHISHWLETGRPIAHINGHTLSLESLQRIARRLQRMTALERERLPGIDAKRAEIIVPGAIVLAHVLSEVGADAITISDFGLREGLVTDYITAHAEEVWIEDGVEGLRLRSVLGCLARFRSDNAHPAHVAKLALALFDGLQPAHGLGPEERELLQFAALLHDIGTVIGHDKHGDHAYYIIQNANLRGLTAAELEVIAAVARYHGKPEPRKRDREFRALSRRDRRTVRWLAAMLRIAEGLDRSHYQLVTSLRVVRRGRRASIRIAAREDARLEIWAARQRTGLLERMMKAPVRLALQQPAPRSRQAPRGTPRPRVAARSVPARRAGGAARRRHSLPKLVPLSGARRTG